ncbi:MAG: (4Fe-4S)-binding protein [Ignavibacteria bacterium]
MAPDLSRVTKKYTNGDITVVWKPARCIHSTKCFNGLPAVFDPTKRPWINAEGSDTEHIISQVNQCPSTALSYFKNSDGGQKKDDHSEAETVAETETVVEAKPNGPLFVYGNITVKTPNGKIEKRTDVTAFCRCGNSNNKPFCDGSHLKADFKG